MNNGQDTMIATVPNINTRSSQSARKLGRATPEVSSNNDHSGNQITTSAEVKKDPVLIEVKPLPKIRLSLMPSPREEDEEENSVSSSSRQPNSSKDGESDQFDSLAARMDLRNLQQQQLQAKHTFNHTFIKSEIFASEHKGGGWRCDVCGGGGAAGSWVLTG